MLRALKPLRYTLGLVPAFALVLWMGANDGSQSYERSPQQVREALRSAQVPIHVLGENIAGSVVRDERADIVVTALVDRNGAEVLHFVTTIEPDGDGSAVTTELRPAHGRNAQNVSGALSANLRAAGLLEKLASEHVAAAIEGRPFDIMFAAPPMADPIMTAVAPGVKDKIAEANQTASELAKAHGELAEAERRRKFTEEHGEDWAASSHTPDDGWGTD
jgi:hypothetical protein